MTYFEGSNIVRTFYDNWYISSPKKATNKKKYLQEIVIIIKSISLLIEAFEFLQKPELLVKEKGMTKGHKSIIYI